MFKKMANLLYSDLSTDAALAHAKKINDIERYFSYARFRQSAKYCADVLRDLGLLQIETIGHPADGTTTYMDCVMPMAWDVKQARLEITSPSDAKPKVLADWQQNPFPVAMRSPPTKPGGDEAQVVLEEDMIAGANVRGKIVLNSTSHHPNKIKKEVAARGGIGVVSDWNESFQDTPNGVYWNNEWTQTGSGWYGGMSEDIRQSNIWCLSLSPEVGLSLRNLLAENNEPVRLRATIDSRLYKGTIKTVTGVIPGTRKNSDEVLILCHLYEPMPSDNAAGAGATLEVLKTLQAAISKRQLPPPQRTIRVVFSLNRSARISNM